MLETIYPIILTLKIQLATIFSTKKVQPKKDIAKEEIRSNKL